MIQDKLVNLCLNKSICIIEVPPEYLKWKTLKLQPEVFNFENQFYIWSIHKMKFRVLNPY